MKKRLNFTKDQAKVLGIVVLLLALPLSLILVRSIQNYRSSASTPDNLETEAGVLSSTGVSKLNSTGASGGSYVLFNKSTGVTSAPSPTTEPGGPYAFPGAQGSGALSKGGRGGVVIEVTNLNDSGTGSLRACVDATGARTCVFRVAGTIVLCSSLRARNPYLTIAGQTSPGGIQIVSAKSTEPCGPNLTGLMHVTTHDVTMRYLRFRNGKSDPITGNQNGHPLAVNDDTYNLMYDHNSLYWTQDENIGIWSGRAPYIYNLTFSYNIITEPLDGHPTNVIMGTDEPSAAPYLLNHDFHHNFLGTSNHRNPQSNKSGSFRWINNIVYNYKYRASQMGGRIKADFISNIYKCGPVSFTDEGCTKSIGTRGVPSPGVREIIWRDDSNYSGNASLYVKGNIGPHNSVINSSNEWNYMVGFAVGGENEPDQGPLGSEHKRSTPLAYPTGAPPIIAESVATLEDSLGLGSTSPAFPVGASRRLDCQGNFVNAYDSNDLRVINEYKTNTAPSSLPNDGVRSDINGVSPCVDSDHDGMPDTWENLKGLNPNNASDRNNIAPNGYTQLENYLNGI